MFVMRSGCVGYRYSEVIFNRATRKVHLFFSDEPIWWKFWQMVPPSYSATYDWACLGAQVVECATPMDNGGVHKEYTLLCVVADEPQGTKEVARFSVGHVNSSGNGASIFQRWQQIRSFMEEDGPYLLPGDSLFRANRTFNIWSALTWGQPLLGPGSKIFWTGEAADGSWFLTIPLGLILLPFLPFTLISGLLRAAARALKREPKWSPDILEELGGGRMDMAEVNARQKGRDRCQAYT